jgi:Regulator of Chromosome Condensation (RCC1) repeat protein
MSSDGRLAFAVVMVVVVGCKDRDRRAPESAAPRAGIDAGIDRDVAAHQRNVALRSEPFDYQMTATACRVPVPSDVTAIDVADLDTAPPTRGDPTRGYEAIVVAEAKAVNHEIGRILIWDRAAKKFVCGNAYEVRGDGLSAATALARTKLFELAPASSDKPTIPDAMAPRTGEKVLRVAIGSNHFCALLEDGSVRCFGQNDAGQCTGARARAGRQARRGAARHRCDRHRGRQRPHVRAPQVRRDHLLGRQHVRRARARWRGRPDRHAVGRRDHAARRRRQSHLRVARRWLGRVLGRFRDHAR